MAMDMIPRGQQFIGLRENLQETIDFHMKYGCFLSFFRESKPLNGSQLPVLSGCLMSLSFSTKEPVGHTEVAQVSLAASFVHLAGSLLQVETIEIGTCKLLA